MKIRTKGLMSKGDRVLMKNGEILTVKALEFTEFVAQEKVGFIRKKEIEGIIIDPTPPTSSDNEGREK